MPIHDNVINLDGFLEGNSQVPYKWSTLKLESDPSDSEWKSIEYFQIRAREFISNVEDLNLPSLWALESNTEGQKVRIETNTYPGKHRAKSIFLDFRHFVADNEPSKYQRVINVIRKHINNSSPLQLFLEELKNKFIAQKNQGVRTLENMTS